MTAVYLKSFADICLLRRGPQDLPPSRWLEILALLGYLAMGSVLGAFDMAIEDSVQSAVADTVLLIALGYGVLWLARKPERTRQTITALAGCGVLLGLVGLPFIAVYYLASDTVQSVGYLLILAITVWNVVVFGHILRHALSLPLLVGIVAALGYIFLSYLAMNLLFGVSG